MLVDVDAIKPGMVLLEDVMLPSGAVLVNSGRTLTESLIDSIRRKGIELVQVAGEEKKEADAPAQPQAAADVKAAATVQPAKAQKKPKVQAFVSEDHMSVSLQVEPLKESENVLTFQDVLDCVREQGVAFGIDEKAIYGFLAKWEKLKKHYEVPAVAKGVPPQPGREGAFVVKVGHIRGDEAIAKARPATHYWELGGVSGGLDRVDGGDVVAERDPGMPPAPGKNVKGEPVFTEEVAKADVAFDPGTIAHDPAAGTLKAKCSGVVYVTDAKVVGVQSVNFDAAVEVKVPNDRTRAELLIHPPGPNGKLPTSGDLQKLLFENKVTFGVKADRLAEVGALLAKGECPAGPVLVAEGILPVHGKNGSVEFLFNTQSSLRPKQNPDGSIDYKNIDIVNTVAKGAKLARLIPPTESTPGKDVSGKEVPSKTGASAKLPAGPNTETSPDDPSLLIAALDGNVRYTGTVVEVSEGYTVKGNVDFSTGNIRYEKSVTIGGDIQSGFSVDCGGDLQVGGTIEDAQLTVGGNVLCKFGFLGSGKGVIECKGDVNLGFVKNQVVRCRGTISVAKESLNATMLSRKAIVLHGNPMSAAGGIFVARDTIEVYSVGNNSGIRTLLEVGLDYVLQDELKKTDEHLAEAVENLRKILEPYKKYEHLQKVRRTLAAADQMLFDKIKATMVKYQQQIKGLEQRKEVIRAKMHSYNNALIKINHSAMPGTVVKIGDRHLLVKEEIVGPKTVRLVNYEIKVF